MSPTYSFPEIKSMVKTLDETSIEILQEVIEDEKDCYDQFELRAFQRFLVIAYKSQVVNEINMEFLLSYN